ncbi:LuxR C-terminal-related transcriptional regulator [Streptomyces sp. J2-1]|uniref:LuxR C-terminal-related transcriptional regulator n=1 Tax=Streptomyces corallincola TaxID=2851888 RepID=UPI001C392AE5|nr:LuxR C-terminal-related transcriptional regulator [Streptomyces corallincola]MBV2355544.1 LuxR C-terminal-related transcriptional regulator [Streptomyces corallincola]
MATRDADSTREPGDDTGTREPDTPRTDPLGEPFLHTRFAPPARPATFLHRPRLTQRLDRALDTPLTMVNGPAGAGKTLLVADWAARLGQPVAWYTGEAAGQGAGMFWASVLHALRTAGVEPPPGVGRPADAGRVDHGLLARLADGLSGRDRPAVLVLDDFDRQTARQVADQLEFVLHHSGPGLRLVLVTRTEPLLPLHRYRAADAMTEIRDADLALTPEEAAGLLALHGLHLPDDAVRGLVARTRGWAAGVRLCAMAAGESADPVAYLREFEAGRSTVADFLLAEVLTRQPARTQELLLRVSVLDRFRPELAEALTGRAGLEPALAALHRENAFVEDLGHSWYRLHPLFGEILRAHLRARHPGLEPELHRRAAHWLGAADAVPEALVHGAAARDWHFTAAALVSDLALGQFFTAPRAGELAALFAPLGPDTRGPAPDLVRAARDLAGPDPARGLAQLRRARAGVGPGGPAGVGAGAAAVGPASAGTAPAVDSAAPAVPRLTPTPAPPALSSPLSGTAPELLLGHALLEAVAARRAGAVGRAEAAVTAARELRCEVPARLLDKHPELSALLLAQVGAARTWAGRFTDARAAFAEATARPGGVATALPRQDCLGQLALIEHLEGRPAKAERTATAALAEAERYGLDRPGSGTLARLVLAAVAVDRADLTRARTLLDGTPVPAAPDPSATACRALVTARLLLARGDHRAAAEAVGTAVAADTPSPWAEVHWALVASAAHLADGRPDSAVKVLDDVPYAAGPAHAAEAARALLAAGDTVRALALAGEPDTGSRAAPGVRIAVALVRAGAALEAGDTATACGLLARALPEARREGLRRPFLEAGPGVRRLLGRPPLHALATGWLLPSAGPPPPARVGGRPPVGGRPEGGPPVVEELSGREREVLLGLAQLLSAEEIAAELYVSVNTVKTHLKSVYRKLGVNRRGDAVRRGREQGLL